MLSGRNADTVTLAPDRLDLVLNAACQTLEMLLGTASPRGPMHACETGASAVGEVNVLVGFAGDVSGQILLAVETAVAIAMAGRMLGMPVEAFDDLTRSAVAEVGNMVAAGCATALTEGGLAVNITVPTLIVGHEVNVSWPQLAVHEGWIETPAGAIAFVTGLKLMGNA